MPGFVVAGILPAVVDGILPPRRTVGLENMFANSQGGWLSCGFSAGQDARLHGRQDACHYDENCSRIPMSRYFNPTTRITRSIMNSSTMVTSRIIIQRLV